MNIWKPGNKKVKKATAQQRIWSDDDSTALPDVISGIPVEGSDAMIGFTSQYSDVGGRQRRPTQFSNPIGIGAGPPLVSPSDLGVIPAPPVVSGNSRRTEMTSPWQQPINQSSDGNWNSIPMGSPTGDQNYGEPSSAGHSNRLPSDSEGSRLRSMSSDPHGIAGCQSNRRARCSSATRNRQNKSKKSELQLSNQSQFVSGSLVMSSSPPTRQGFSTEGRQRGFPAPDTFLTGASTLPAPGSSYGYQVSNLEALLTQATPSSPANLPMVLASPTQLHNTRTSQESCEATARPRLPLGIIVNAVFKTRDWLYIRTAHGDEGYVPYRVCLPLGILPPNHVSQNPMGMHGAWELRGVQDPEESLRHPKPNSSMENPERGRSRGRRRDNTNQTDLQKLHPTSRTARETLDPPMFNGPPHLV